jgi:hypothetical protein
MTLPELLAEQARLIRELELWRQVKLQGIDPDEVSTFTFRDEFLSSSEQKERRRQTLKTGIDPFACRKTGKVFVYNCVRLTNGELRQLQPMLNRP